MIIGIEGCIGVGKTTLSKLIGNECGFSIFTERFNDNPFLMDFYKKPDKYAFHAHTTFLFLQNYVWNNALELPNTSILDFHPIKSMIFAKKILKKEEEFKIAEKLHKYLFPPCDNKNQLLVILTADINVILSRIKKRNDVYADNIKTKYLETLIDDYNNFDYGNLNTIKIDTTDMDFVRSQDDYNYIRDIIFLAIQK